MNDFAELIARARQDLNRAAAPGEWSLAQVLEHSAQSIEYSLDGYPVAKPWIVRKLIGPMIKRKFLRQGFMRHDLSAVIPGAPELASQSAAEALARLERAMARFEAHSGDFAPHFAFGATSKDEYRQLHDFHLADHLRIT